MLRIGNNFQNLWSCHMVWKLQKFYLKTLNIDFKKCTRFQWTNMTVYLIFIAFGEFSLNKLGKKHMTSISALNKLYKKPWFLIPVQLVCNYLTWVSLHAYDTTLPSQCILPKPTLSELLISIEIYLVDLTPGYLCTRYIALFQSYLARPPYFWCISRCPHPTPSHGCLNCWRLPLKDRNNRNLSLISQKFNTKISEIQLRNQRNSTLKSQKFNSEFTENSTQKSHKFNTEISWIQHIQQRNLINSTPAPLVCFL